MSLKIIFAGTPEFAAVALEALLNSPHQIVAVYTQPDRKAGRGLQLMASPVKALATRYELPVYQPASLKSETEQGLLKQLNADVMVVAAYGMLLPSAVLTIPRFGCLNIHPSLLPRWRGAAPIQRTIFAGDKVSGVTIMQMDAGLDTGPMLLQKTYRLDEAETTKTLHDKLALMGANALLETLTLLEQHQLQPQIQDNQQTTYANKITKEEALIDWHESAEKIEWMVRAFNPWPVAYTTFKGEPLRIWQAKAIASEKKAEPRTVLQASKEGVDIATGDGALRLLQVQIPGGKVVAIADFFNANHPTLSVGEKLV